MNYIIDYLSSKVFITVVIVCFIFGWVFYTIRTEEASETAKRKRARLKRRASSRYNEYRERRKTSSPARTDLIIPDKDLNWEFVDVYMKDKSSVYPDTLIEVPLLESSYKSKMKKTLNTIYDLDNTIKFTKENSSISPGYKEEMERYQELCERSSHKGLAIEIKPE